MTSDTQSSTAPTERRRRPLESIERRVLGVLVEKAKTTPEAYPLSLNALRTGCNQKNNRAPLMLLEESQVEEACEQLRKSGAISQVQGTSRVDRYRHLAYEWLAVDKVELAVMAELLLRGAQTVGELRGRAARMEPIKDLGDLQPTLDTLAAKGLIMYLTPPGRGSVVTHTLYLDREMEKVRREAGAAYPEEPAAQREPAGPRSVATPTPTATGPNASVGESRRNAGDVSAEIAALRDQIASMKSDLAAVRADFESTAAELRRDLADLNRQLGN